MSGEKVPEYKVVVSVLKYYYNRFGDLPPRNRIKTRYNWIYQDPKKNRQISQFIGLAIVSLKKDGFLPSEYNCPDDYER